MLEIWKDASLVEWWPIC